MYEMKCTMFRNEEEEEEDDEEQDDEQDEYAMKMMNVFREFWWWEIGVRSENDCWCLFMHVVTDVMVHNDSSLKICTFYGNTYKFKLKRRTFLTRVSSQCQRRHYFLWRKMKRFVKWRVLLLLRHWRSRFLRVITKRQQIGIRKRICFRLALLKI